MSLELLPAPTVSNGVRSAKLIAKEEGVSDTTIFRRVKAGLLVKVNINGRAYITIDSLQAFYERARKGEFTKKSHFAKAG